MLAQTSLKHTAGLRPNVLQIKQCTKIIVLQFQLVLVERVCVRVYDTNLSRF